MLRLMKEKPEIEQLLIKMNCYCQLILFYTMFQYSYDHCVVFKLKNTLFLRQVKKDIITIFIVMVFEWLFVNT